MMNERTASINNEESRVYRIKNDINGNPRFIVHFLSLGLEKYESIAKLTSFKKYQGKAFGGGYVFQSYDSRPNLEEDLKFATDILKENGLIK